MYRNRIETILYVKNRVCGRVSYTLKLHLSVHVCVYVFNLQSVENVLERLLVMSCTERKKHIQHPLCCERYTTHCICRSWNIACLFIRISQLVLFTVECLAVIVEEKKRLCSVLTECLWKYACVKKWPMIVYIVYKWPHTVGWSKKKNTDGYSYRSIWWQVTTIATRHNNNLFLQFSMRFINAYCCQLIVWNGTIIEID